VILLPLDPVGSGNCLMGLGIRDQIAE
jgi:hypothetical protein